MQRITRSLPLSSSPLFYPSLISFTLVTYTLARVALFRYYTAEKIPGWLAKFQPFGIAEHFHFFGSFAIYSGALVNEEGPVFFLISFYSICGYQVVLQENKVLS